MKRIIEVDITLSPKELAEQFWLMGSEKQAEFFNTLGFIAGVQLCFQLQHIIDGTSITNDGRDAMRLIGEYGNADL